MPRTHFIFDRTQKAFFRTHIPSGLHNEDTIPDAGDKAEADLYEQHEACAICDRFYGLNWHTRGKAEIIQATTAEYLSWRGRKGGSVTSAKKQRVSRRNGRRGGRKRICRSCGDELAPTVPVNVHVCEECKA